MITPAAIRAEKLVPRISSAPFWFFCPILMAQSGAPPMPRSRVTAVIRVMTGRETLRAAIAFVPFSMRPIKIRSTML